MEQRKIESSSGITQQAKLPLFLEGQTVEGMSPGESRAVQTHAMVVDTNYDLWLVSAWKTYSNPSEEHPLIITRLEDGYEVDATLVEDPGWFKNPDLAEFEESEERRLLPVLGIKFEVPKY